ncbi:NAD(P)-binding domain-containing protein, partial [Candidatus Woesearchaeota archaeon]|nr:NAD(P)-binding domain-containing protein [Candidatus Woesearchaeota archaeon]
MQLGFMGLGRMGKNIVLRLLASGHKIAAYNRSPEPIKEVQKKGATAAYTIEDMFKALA